MGQSKSKGNIKACVDASLAVMQKIAYARAKKRKKLGAMCGITCFGCKKKNRGTWEKIVKISQETRRAFLWVPPSVVTSTGEVNVNQGPIRMRLSSLEKLERQRTIELHVSVVKNRGTWVRIVKIPRGNKKGLSPGLCPGWGGNLGGMIADQSPIRMGLCSLRSR